MYAASIGFNRLPDIGFAMSHKSVHYKNTYGKSDKMSIEIAYITSGCVKVCFDGQEMYAEKGSVLVLFRHIPVYIETVGNVLHTHLTVLGEFCEYDFELCGDGELSKDGMLCVPFVTQPCRENEEIAKQICKISSDMAFSREENALSCSIRFVWVLSRLSETYKKKTNTHSATEKLTRLIKEYIRDNLERSITVEDLCRITGRSKSHISHTFKAFCGMTVKEYINSERIKRTAYLMRNEQVPFVMALEKSGIFDESYGYRLFKKYTGITPGQYMSGKHVVMDK